MVRIFKDQLGNEVEVSFPPQRIVSLVPSQTELLFDLGLKQQIVGVTKFCIHPKALRESKVKVGGTKKIDFEKIADLQPDLIIANKEENTQKEIELLQSEYPVWISDISDLQSAIEMIHLVGQLTDRTEKADLIIKTIKNGFIKSPSLNLKVAYFIWKNPYMAAGNVTFINSMLSYAGFINAFAMYERYPVVTLEELRSVKPDLIFLSSEPYPFGEKHVEEFKIACPNSKIILVDGEYFSWYGSRLLGAVNYFQELREKLIE